MHRSGQKYVKYTGTYLVLSRGNTGKIVLLQPQTPSYLILLSKRREVMVVCGDYDGQWRGGGWLVIFLQHVPSKNKMGSECRVSVCINSVLRCMGSCGNTSWKQICFYNELWVQWLRNYELVVALTSGKRCSSWRTIAIIDDYLIQ